MTSAATDIETFLAAVDWWDNHTQDTTTGDLHITRHTRPHGDDGTETIELAAAFTTDGAFDRGARIVRHVDGITALEFHDFATAVTIAHGEQV